MLKSERGRTSLADRVFVVPLARRSPGEGRSRATA